MDWMAQIHQALKQGTYKTVLHLCGLVCTTLRLWGDCSWGHHNGRQLAGISSGHQKPDRETDEKISAGAWYVT